MKLKRARNQPDKRLDWRDPNMPVLMRVSYDKGQTFQLCEIEPVAVQKYYEQKIIVNSSPSWRYDETYDMKRRK